MGVVRALAANVKNNDISQGASTITQQLSRNLYLSHERSFSRKFTELLCSLKVKTVMHIYMESRKMVPKNPSAEQQWRQT